MGHKQFCDVCGVEIPPSHTYDSDASAHFYGRGRSIDLCWHCGEATERFLNELKETHETLQNAKGKLHGLKDQKELGDFEQRQ